MITNKVVSVKKITVFSAEFPDTFFQIENSKGYKYIITIHTKLQLNDKNCTFEEILDYFKKNKNNIAKIDLEDYDVISINFMAIE